MATPRWPVTLPQEPDPGSWVRSPQDNRITFKPDVGPPIVRRRSTVRAHRYDPAFSYLTDAGLVIFEDFFEGDLVDGSLHYLWLDPQSKIDFKWRIIAYNFDSIGAALHRLTMQIIRLPGAAV